MKRLILVICGLMLLVSVVLTAETAMGQTNNAVAQHSTQSSPANVVRLPCIDPSGVDKLVGAPMFGPAACPPRMSFGPGYQRGFGLGFPFFGRRTYQGPYPYYTLRAPRDFYAREYPPLGP